MRDNQNKHADVQHKTINEVLLQVQRELERLDKKQQTDAYHDAKRRLSFDTLDRLLDSCERGFCPCLNPEEHELLIDISAEGYILERAYFYSNDNIGTDNEDRYYMARNRIMGVFDCQVDEPKLGFSLFKKDCCEIEKSQYCGNGAKKRKAYWRYLARNVDVSKDSSAKNDFCDACGMLDSLCKSGKKRTKQLWKNNLDIINGIDLFRYCLFRSKSLAHENE